MNISKTVRVNIVFPKNEYSISFLMISKLIDFALVVLYFSMFKVCGIIGISKIEFLNFPELKELNKIKKYIYVYIYKSHSKPP